METEVNACLELDWQVDTPPSNEVDALKWSGMSCQCFSVFRVNVDRQPWKIIDAGMANNYHITCMKIYITRSRYFLLYFQK